MHRSVLTTVHGEHGIGWVFNLPGKRFRLDSYMNPATGHQNLDS